MPPIQVAAPSGDDSMSASTPRAGEELQHAATVANTFAVYPSSGPPQDRLPQSFSTILNDPSNAGVMELLRVAEHGLAEVDPVDYKWALRRQVEHIRSVEEAFNKMDISAMQESDWPRPARPATLPVVAEIFCGSARLTKTFIKEGVAAMGVDNKRNRHQLQGPALTLDLTEPGDRDLLWEWLENSNIAFIHMAPPCGTASRAREKPLPKGKGKGKAPRPLRSEQMPWGLEDRDQHVLMKGC